MSSVSAWGVSPNSIPLDLRPAQLPSEDELERWVYAKPAIVAHGIETVRRQLPLGGKRLDILCVEDPGTWIIIELKKFNVSREALVQGVDYAARLGELTFEEFSLEVKQDWATLTPSARELIIKALDREQGGEGRDIRVVLAGVGASSDLERMVRYVGSFELPIRVCDLTCLESPTNTGFILLRDNTIDGENDPTEVPGFTSYDERMAIVLAHAESLGQRPLVEAMIKEFSDNDNLYVRPYKRGIMIAPASQKSRYLVYFAPRNDGVMGHFGVKELQEFFPLLETDFLQNLPERAVFSDGTSASAWAGIISSAVELAATGQEEVLEEWDGSSYYVSFGETDRGRSWDDARKFGFVSAGGGDWYSRSLVSLPVGATVYTCIPGIGYVGVGRTTGPAIRFDESDISTRTDLLGAYEHPNGEPEFIVPVEWEKTTTRDKALWQTGWFANRNSACRLKHGRTIEALKEWVAS